LYQAGQADYTVTSREAVVDLPRRDLESITVDLRCGGCDRAPVRCGKCQAIVDAAVAATLAEGVAAEHIRVA
jgi:hypothetical protein